MPLARIKERETITLTNYSYADGEVTLVHPKDIPLQTLDNLLYTPAGLEEYAEFSVCKGVTSPEDFVLLMEMSSAVAREFSHKLQPYLKDDGIDTSPGGDIAPKELSAENEAILAEFTKKMGILPDAIDPFASDEDEGGDDGLASV